MFRDKHFLVLDDSTAIRNYLQSVLIRQGARVDIAATGQQGLDMCSGDDLYDLILLDLILPDMNGIQVLEHIRQENDESTVVILTGVGGIKSAIAAVQHGADAYVEKQDISAGGDLAGFFYVLEQAFEHRAGLVAQKHLEEIKTSFYSMVTHNLRNPDGFILTSIRTVLEGEFGPLANDQVNFLDTTQRSAHKIVNLISNYLDFTHIDAGYLRLNLSDVELHDVVQASAQLARLQAQSKSQSLVLDLPPDPVPARVDAERLQQVLDNLLSNALKYTPEGGRITVQLRIEDGQAVFRVSDTGQGIPPNQLPALFTKYHLVPGKAVPGIHGAGLGLLIVKEITEAHGGTVHAESKGIAGKGTTFTVSIPLEPTGK